MLKEIGEEAFSGCVGLKKITIPETVKTIYKDAFNGCTSLTEVTIEGQDVVLKDGVFSGCTAMDKINSTTAKTIDLAKFSAIGANAFDFGRKVEFTVLNKGAIVLEDVFGETDFAG